VRPHVVDRGHQVAAQITLEFNLQRVKSAVAVRGFIVNSAESWVRAQAVHWINRIQIIAGKLVRSLCAQIADRKNCIGQQSLLHGKTPVL
jgi:hypothetical protein